MSHTSRQPFELGVCGWSIDRHDAVRSLEVAGDLPGLHVVQIGFFSEQAIRKADADAIRRTAERAGVRLIGAFIAFEGEDYTSIERIAATGGFGLDEAYPSRRALTHDAGRLVAALGCRNIAVHVGTVPTDSASEMYARLVARTGEVADLLAGEGGVRLLLETGREPASTLVEFVAAVGRESVGINFDPGNFVVYGTDEPAGAVCTLGSRIECVHMKDAVRSDEPGCTYGRAALLGEGDVGIRQVLRELESAGYVGPLLIECSGRDRGPDAVRAATDRLRAIVDVTTEE
jgi:sugar phosphate isomerase/epimerase